VEETAMSINWDKLDSIEGVGIYIDTSNNSIVRAIEVGWGDKAWEMCDLLDVPSHVDYYSAFFLDGVFCGAWEYLVADIKGKITRFSSENFKKRFKEKQ
jgi:hypothetical protein